MQNGLNPGCLASFAGRLLVTSKAEGSRRPHLARVAPGWVSGLSDGALDYFGLRTKGAGSEGASRVKAPRLPWRYV